VVIEPEVYNPAALIIAEIDNCREPQWIYQFEFSGMWN
jgi:hypothetical protein